MRHNRAIAGAAAALAASIGLAGQANAASCNGARIDPRFTEAARLCDAPATPASAAVRAVSAAMVMPTVAASGAMAQPAPSSVSVSMPGYRRPVRLVRTASGVRGTPVAPDRLAMAVGQRYRIDPHLLTSMVTQESGGRPGAISNKGALGLMQVMPGTARSLGIAEPRALLGDPVLAMSAGAVYLKRLQAQFGNNVPLVLAAYNAGPGAVVKARGVPRYRETQGYVGAIMSRYARVRGAR